MPHSVESSRPRAGRAAGFTLLELLIVIALVSLLFLVAADRLLPLRGQAEAAHVAAVSGVLRSSLGLTTAKRIVNDGLASVADLADSNAFELLDHAPERYLGELDNPDPATITPGSWYFDRTSKTLAYRVRFPQYLVDSPEGPVILQWRVVLHLTPEPTGPDAETRPHIQGISLARLDQHSWQKQIEQAGLP